MFVCAVGLFIGSDPLWLDRRGEDCRIGETCSRQSEKYQERPIQSYRVLVEKSADPFAKAFARDRRQWVDMSDLVAESRTVLAWTSYMAYYANTYLD